jgi:S-adenosylmethionine decarboxylase
MSIKRLGTHIMVDMWELPYEFLNDPDAIKKIILEAVEAGNATLIDCSMYKFEPQGVTGVATIAESHISMHSWPENNYLAMDFFFCNCDGAITAWEYVKRKINPNKFRVQEFARGIEEDM